MKTMLPGSPLRYTSRISPIRSRPKIFSKHAKYIVMLWILISRLRNRRQVRDLVLFDSLMCLMLKDWLAISARFGLGSFKLYANVARFHRPPLKVNNPSDVKDSSLKSASNDVGINSNIKSYVHVVNGSQSMTMDDTHAIVLDKECLNESDLNNSIMGRVKEFASLSNLKKAITNEGFVDYTIRYLGELWVMLDFVSTDSKKLFLNNLGVKSWFSSLKDASPEFMPEGRIVWMDVEGIPLKLWTHNTFKQIAAKWGVLLDSDDQENTYMHSKRMCLITKSAKKISENFKIIFHGNIYWIRANKVPGWVPDFLDDVDEDESDTNSKGGDSINYDDDSQGDVPETEFGLEKQSNDIPATEHIGQTGPTSEDPFSLYPLINKKMSNKGEGGNSD
uniref:Glucose-methanol-choline oxidoreductase, FAD/NAD(P)-binding domain protein n=1 Tax=Tanacetum cinerariifolium TaxID=118510 RepID=A0A699ILR6_TANCI|nr:glucose-methanol-choline oxidoreductase, FAD/NAD(P)-binding domain protein [Tanacetum cinerariifolium]